MAPRILFAAFIVWAAALLGASPAQASVHAGDELFVTVYGHPELSGPVTVDSTRHVSLPLVGPVDVRNLDTSQISARITQALRSYLREPGVNVQLKTQLAVVFVSGGPGGTLKYEPGATLIAALGNLTPRMVDVQAKDAASTQSVPLAELERSRYDLRHVGLTRDDVTVGTYDALDLFARGEGGPILQAGDTLSITNKPNLVRVTGEVARPGATYLANGEPLGDALAQAGGLLPTASTTAIQLRRDNAVQLIRQGDQKWSEPAKAGDSLTIPVAPRVNIVGLVERPGAVTLKNNATLLSALYEAGGPTKWADLTNVQVLAGGSKYAYNITRLVHGDATQNPDLHDGDVVLVPEGHQISLTSVFQGILSAAALLIRL